MITPFLKLKNQELSPAKGNIIWLASYPKSGNTWLRIFLSNLLAETEEPIGINNLFVGGPMASDRPLFDEYMGLDSAHLTREEIDNLLPKAHLHRSQLLEEKRFVKTHDACGFNGHGESVIPIEATHKAVYLVRNPLDVCVSYVHHSGHKNHNQVIKNMNNSQYILAESVFGQNKQLHQNMLSWSGHIKSWQKVMEDRILMVRYEDMKLRPLSVFSKIVDFVELEYSTEDIKKALEYSSMPHLQQQEAKNGFREKMYKAKRFFRKGEIGSWREELTNEQVQQLVSHHADVMRDLAYLDESDQIIF